LLFILFFASCSVSSLKLTDNGDIFLNYSDDSCKISLNTQKREFLNFKDLFIQRFKTKSVSGTVLFAEHIYTDSSYEFNFGGLSTVMYAFDDSRKYEEVYIRNNLKLVQIQLKDKRYVNVMIQANQVQAYSFIYGFTNDEFFKIAKKIKTKDGVVIKPRFDVVTLRNDSKALTNWNDLLIFFTPLIVPLRELMTP
jgi:hypothetical protein